MKRTTGSAAARVLACPGSMALPHINRTSEFADAGSWRHVYLQNVRELGVEEALKLIPKEYREMCEVIDYESLPTNLACEVAFAWDSFTLEARELGRNLNRDYSDCTSTEVPLTVDVLGISEDAVYICDYKGWEYVSVEDNAQLLLGALSACKVYGKQRAILEIVHIRGGEHSRHRTEVDVFDLGMFEVRLMQAMAFVREAQRLATLGKTPDVTEGPHCKYCPAFDSCPAKTALIRQAAGDELTSKILPLRPETAAQGYEMWLAMKAMTKRVGEAIYAYASERDIELPNNKVFGMREKLGSESLDGEIVYNVVKDLYGQEAADKATTRSATKKAIDSVAREVAKERSMTIKAANASVLDEVRKRGGASRPLNRAVGVHKAKLPEKKEEAA